MSDDFDRFVDRVAPDYNRPPDPPREEMWAVIRTRLPAARRDPLDLDARRAKLERRRRLRRFTPWAIGIATAATLAVGFGLGRLSGDRPVGGAEPVVARAEAAPSASVRLAAADHLGEAEALLTFYRTAGLEADRGATARWAQDLLSTTRMMMDARAGADPAIALLLADLELVLVQIVAAGEESLGERDLIEETMERRQLLPKLRNASSAPLKKAM